MLKQIRFSAAAVVIPSHRSSGKSTKEGRIGCSAAFALSFLFLHSSRSVSPSFFFFASHFAPSRTVLCRFWQHGIPAVGCACRLLKDKAQDEACLGRPFTSLGGIRKQGVSAPRSEEQGLCLCASKVLDASSRRKHSISGSSSPVSYFSVWMTQRLQGSQSLSKFERGMRGLGRSCQGHVQQIRTVRCAGH